MDENGFTDRYIFDASAVPRGFRFPLRYVQLITGPAVLPDLAPWWFLAQRRQLADFWLVTVRKQYPSRRLIPVAKREDLSDTLACFDGDDLSGNPVVHHIHAYTEPGWEQRGTWTDFDDWLREAHADAAEFRAAEAMAPAPRRVHLELGGEVIARIDAGCHPFGWYGDARDDPPDGGPLEDDGDGWTYGYLVDSPAFEQFRGLFASAHDRSPDEGDAAEALREEVRAKGGFVLRDVVTDATCRHLTLYQSRDVVWFRCDNTAAP